MARTTVFHLGDYDPVGLSEYLRLEAVLGSRAVLYVPPDLEDLLRRFGKPALLAGQTEVLARLRACGNS